MLGNCGVELPDIWGGNFHELRECAVLIDADDAQVLADVRFAQPALVAVAAIHVHFGADEIALLDCGYFVADALDDAAEFVAQGQGRLDAPLRPAVPAVNVQVGSADRSRLHAH